jgi:hypothetical protein
MTDDSTRWLTIMAGTRERREIDAYLYASTTVVAVLNDGFGEVYIAVTVDMRAVDPNAPFLAQYQADRLMSGMIRAVVSETFTSARAVAMAQLHALQESAF